MRTATVFDGGHLQTTWVPLESNMREIGGRMFYAIRKSDRAFARALGLDVHVRSPFQDARVLDYLTFLRNQAVDTAMAQAKLGEGVAEGGGEAVARQRRQQWPRYERFDAVPQVLEISIPPLEGVRGHKMNVASTANYSFVLEFELNETNVEYLYEAFASSPPADFGDTSKRKRCQKLRPMYSDTPDVVERPRYGCDGPRVTVAATSYIDNNGQKRSHSAVIRLTEEHEQLGTAQAKKRNVALAVQLFHDENHNKGAAQQNGEGESEAHDAADGP